MLLSRTRHVRSFSTIPVMRTPLSCIVNVPMAEYRTVQGQEILKTHGLGDCSALVILRKPREGIFYHRTMMHIIGSALRAPPMKAYKPYVLYPCAGEILQKFVNEILKERAPIKVIIGFGISSSSSIAREILIHSDYKGHKLVNMLLVYAQKRVEFYCDGMILEVNAKGQATSTGTLLNGADGWGWR